MARLRLNLKSGHLTAPLTAGDTTLQSAELAALPTVASPDYLLLTLDEREIVRVTTHTAGSTFATIERAAEGTAATAHAAGVRWTHGAVASDFEGGGWETISCVNPTLGVTTTVTSGSYSPVLLQFTLDRTRAVRITAVPYISSNITGGDFRIALSNGSTTWSFDAYFPADGLAAFPGATGMKGRLATSGFSSGAVAKVFLPALPAGTYTVRYHSTNSTLTLAEYAGVIEVEAK